MAATAGCAALSQTVVPVEGADAEPAGAIARIAVSPTRPVLLRAVDGKPVSGIQVSSSLRQYVYLVRPGNHVLWVSSAPYGFPFLPQRLRCFVVTARLSAGSAYELSYDSSRETALLVHAGDEPENAGVLVDAPLVHQRGCEWK